MKRRIFVFGSNLSGIHGAGAAKAAVDHHGAIYGEGEGFQGKSYALPTKGYQISFMPLEDVKFHVDQFIKAAEMHPELVFQVTRVGCGLAGFKDEQIAPLFKDAPDNCFFDIAWKPFLSAYAKFWGSVP